MAARHIPALARPEDRRQARAAARSGKSAAARAARKLEKAASRELLEAGTLLAEIAPHKAGSRRLPAWALNPRDASLVVEWAAGAGHPRILAAPAYSTAARYPSSAPVRISRAQFSPSGRYLAFACGRPYDTVTVWEWPEREVCRFSLGLPAVIEFDATEELLCCATSRGACVVRIASAEVLSQVAFEARGAACALAPSGGFAVFGTGASGLVISEFPSLLEIRSIATRKRPVAPPHTRRELVALLKTHDMNDLAAAMSLDKINALKFSRDGTWLFAGSEFGMRAWKWQSLRESKGSRAPAPVHQSPARPAGEPGRAQCHALAYDDFNARLLFAGAAGVVEYLDLETGTIGPFLRPPGLHPLSHLALSPDQRVLVTQSRESGSTRAPELRVWSYPALCWKAGLKVRSRQPHLF